MMKAGISLMSRKLKATPSSCSVMTATFWMVMLLSLAGFSHSFEPLLTLSGKSVTHRLITQKAILRKTAEVCRDVAIAKGEDFSLVIDDSLSASQVQWACTPSKSWFIFSTVTFQRYLDNMHMTNSLVDLQYILHAKYHFDDELFEEGRDVIKTAMAAVKKSVKDENFVAGRMFLAQVFHMLQDFYSHSNWIELGNRVPYSALIRPAIPLKNLAGRDTPTCRNCIKGNCDDNLLPDLKKKGLLTSGYFSITSEAKPQGKCSHGSLADKTSQQEPVGGINKDKEDSSHGSYHHKAAEVAVLATMELLEDIRLAVGVPNFLRLMGLSQSSAMCFVIDTTGSMGKEIAEVRRQSFSFIDKKKGTPAEPFTYILVPFNDPEVGPATKTTDSDVFKSRISELVASEGGDNPEMAMSGLQLALMTAPSNSEIFFFTDAEAKDVHLRNTVKALIESKKIKINFVLTGSFVLRRRRSVYRTVYVSAARRINAALYNDLARVSGGTVIMLDNKDISKAAEVIEDILSTAVVTVFQVSRNPGKPDSFTFLADASLINMTAYITGTPFLTFSLRNPTGVAQTSSQSTGPLGSFSKVGNLHRLRINTDNQTGLWELTVTSNSPYSVKVTGQSSIDFVFNIIERHKGGHGEFSLKVGRPLTGGNISLMITVTDSDTVKVTQVTLVDISGTTEIPGSLQFFGRDTLLVTFIGVPEGENVVRLRGIESSTSTPSSFQRQGSTQIKMSTISVTTQSNSTSVEPGSTVDIPFTVSITINGVVNVNATERFTVRANNDQRYPSTSPSTLTIAAGDGGQARGIVTLKIPSNATSGTAVTLTIEVENAAGNEINYAILHFSVNAKVTDIIQPVCQVISLSGNCSSSSAQWTFYANFNDGVNGTGIERVSIRQGNGTLNTSTVVGAGGENITMATYTASCCSPTVELVAVDRVGNVGTCAGYAVTPAVRAAVNTASIRGHNLNIFHCFWISVVVSLFWK